MLLLLVLSWGFTLLYPPVDRTPELGPVDFVGLGVVEHCPGHWLRCPSGKVSDFSRTLSSVSQAWDLHLHPRGTEHTYCLLLCCDGKSEDRYAQNLCLLERQVVKDTQTSWQVHVIWRRGRKL